MEIMWCYSDEISLAGHPVTLKTRRRRNTQWSWKLEEGTPSDPENLKTKEHPVTLKTRWRRDTQCDPEDLMKKGHPVWPWRLNENRKIYIQMKTIIAFINLQQLKLWHHELDNVGKLQSDFLNSMELHELLSTIIKKTKKKFLLLLPTPSSKIQTWSLT